MSPRILWIDGVGSYALCDGEETSIGQAVPSNPVDLAIRGDLSRRAASIRRLGEDHVLNPYSECYVDGALIHGPTLLVDEMRFSLGRVDVQYLRPSKLSTTGRLELVGNHRWQPLLSAALLLGESCVLGPDSGCHIRCLDWTWKLTIFKMEGRWLCRVPETANVEVDGMSVGALFPLEVGRRIRGDEISMILE